MLRKIGPQVFLPAILTLWGIVVISEGFVTSFRGLVVARAFLGLVEGPMFPGIVLYLSGFYTREELSLRYFAVKPFSHVMVSKTSQGRLFLFRCIGMSDFANAQKHFVGSMSDNLQLSGAFSGLLAAAIVKMHGVSGKPGWAWIFILVSTSTRSR